MNLRALTSSQTRSDRESLRCFPWRSGVTLVIKPNGPEPYYSLVGGRVVELGDSGHPAVHVPAPRSAKSPICLSGVSGEEGSRGAAPSGRVLVEIKAR